MSTELVASKKDPRDIDIGGLRLSETGIIQNGAVTWEQWYNTGLLIQRCDGSIQWWIGDWLIFGEGRPEWGDKYEQAISIFNLPYNTLAAYKKVALAFDVKRRLPNLSWSAHQAVAYLDAPVQNKILKEAQPSEPDRPPRLSVKEIRIKVREKHALAKKIAQEAEGNAPPTNGKPKVDVRLFADLENMIGGCVRANSAIKRQFGGSDHAESIICHEVIRQHLNGILNTLKTWRRSV